MREPPDEVMRSAATEGIRTPAVTLPFLDRIQASFGHYSLGHVKAHVGTEAAKASRAMNASAFASGDHVVFSGTPDLRTAAHEAAHIVQQRARVHLPGGIGRKGDACERHADGVASAVVAGRSVEALLEPFGAALPEEKRNGTAISAEASSIRDGNVRRASIGAELVLQRNPHKQGDLYYGFSDDRWSLANEFVGRYSKKNLASIDDYNNRVGITWANVANDKYEDTINRIKNPNVSYLDPNLQKWMEFLREPKHLEYIDVRQQIKEKGLSDDRFYKNAENVSTTLREHIERWAKGATFTAKNDPEIDKLNLWIGYAFFRKTSKLGLNFAQKMGFQVHWNLTRKKDKDVLAKHVLTGKAKKGNKPLISPSEFRYYLRNHFDLANIVTLWNFPRQDLNLLRPPGSGDKAEISTINEFELAEEYQKQRIARS